MNIFTDVLIYVTHLSTDYLYLLFDLILKQTYFNFIILTFEFPKLSLLNEAKFKTSLVNT